jgi:predicted phage replisome organizer
MSEVTWFKVLTDIFSDDKIKIIQSMPEGDALLVMWFKVLSQAGKTNDGGYIYLKKNIPYTAGMLSTLFSKQQQLVELAMRTFVEFGMIDIDEKGYIFVTHWERHQSIDKLNQLKEKTNLRVQRHREKKKLELMECNVTETLPKRPINAVERELDIELDKEKDTLSCKSDFDKVSKAYADIHKVLELPYSNGPLLSKLLDEGIPPDHIIGVIKEKYREGITTLKFYEGAIRDSWNIPNHGPKLVPSYAIPKKTGIPDMSETQLHLDEMTRLQEAKRKRIAERATS